MAEIETVQAIETLVSAPWQPSTPAGDTIVGVASFDDLLVEIRNGHTSAITVSIPPVDTSLDLPRVGEIRKFGIVVSVPAGGQYAAIIPAKVVARYKDTEGNIPVSYTGGNAALLIRALQSDSQIFTFTGLFEALTIDGETLRVDGEPLVVQV